MLNWISKSSWLNFITFDIIGDLSFGESFGCLQGGIMHPWVKIMFSSLRDIVYIAALSHLPKPIFKVVMGIISYFMIEDLEKDRKFSAQRVHRRLQQGTHRDDFMSPILRAKGERGMTIPEIEASFNILVVAGKSSFIKWISKNILTSLGSETSATLLSGALYNLAMHPDVQSKLLSELSSAFKCRNEVNMAALSKLPYLNAVLEECLRIYPPSAFNQARIVPSQGAIVCGEMVPPGTAVGVATWAASHSKKNWTEPEKFRPDRWLGEGFPGDDRRSMQPFILGPRSCIGKKYITRLK